MKPKFAFQIGVDFAMTILLLLLMARQLTGESAHEWLGAGMFLLWIVHHIFNLKWHRRLFQGKYTPYRVIQGVVNFLLFLSMLGTMVSAVILSREVFAFLPLSGGIALARSMHILCVFWSFVLMSLHLGLHWNMILGMVRKAAGPISSKPKRAALWTVGILVAAYGLYAFLKNQIPSYLFLQSSFVFFDFERPMPLFFTEYIAMMGFFVLIAHAGTKWVQRRTSQKKAEKAYEK